MSKRKQHHPEFWFKGFKNFKDRHGKQRCYHRETGHKVDLTHWKKRTDGGRKVSNLRGKASNLTEPKVSHEENHNYISLLSGARGLHQHIVL